MSSARRLFELPEMRLNTRSMYHYTDFSRRPVLVIFCTLAVLCVFYLKDSVLPPSVPVINPSSVAQCPNVPPESPYAPAESGGFKWRDASMKHPVEHIRRLSNDRARRLPRIQHRFKPLVQDARDVRQGRQRKVKQVFQRCWNSYRDAAWLKDELAPVSGGSKDPFGGWGATLVDSLDTLWLMEMFDEFDEAVAAALTIDFGPETSSLTEINIFETTIRYLGGFLAAYDMTECTDPRLLDKAMEVGDLIYKAYDTPNRMPVTRWNPRDAAAGKEQKPLSNALIAELGSSGLELTRLSQVSGDMRYYDQAIRLADLFEDQQNKTSLPGMWPILTDAEKANLTVGNDYSLGGMSDSAYEYLPKMYELMGGINAGPQHERLYRAAMDTAVDKLLYRPMLPDDADVLIPTGYHVNGSSGFIDNRGEHLACFVGGMLALGGRLFNLPDHVDMGRKVTDGCVWAYKHSRLGMMPEIMEMVPCKSKTDCVWDESRFKGHRLGDMPLGFIAIHDGRYILRPEAIESVFYLYRITGDEKYQDVAWDMFTAIEKYTHTDLANAALANVNSDNPGQMDSMESFWMGETLKYFYLIFSDPALISLDDFVFNTEAHPFRRPR